MKSLLEDIADANFGLSSAEAVVELLAFVPPFTKALLFSLSLAKCTVAMCGMDHKTLRQSSLVNVAITQGNIRDLLSYMHSYS